MPTALRAAALMLLGGLPLAAFAQQAPSNEPRTETEYFDADWKKLPGPVGAHYRTETQYQDSLQATQRTFYASGARYSVTPYEHLRKRQQHGVSESWYENGQLKWRDNAAHGKLEGELLYYYPSGQLKRREVYAAGERREGHCYGPQGQVVPFFEYQQLPVPPGGMDGLMQYLGQNIRYNAKSLRKGLQGQVLVGFIVDATGQVRDVTVRRSLHPLLDQEAVRVIRAMPAWAPGLRDGEPAATSYVVPLTFVIR